MIWATGDVDRGNMRSLELLFCDQATAFDLDRRMLLICDEIEGDRIRLFVAVPDLDLLQPYLGFRPCPRRELPIAPVLIAGCPNRFGAIFHGS